MVNNIQGDPRRETTIIFILWHRCLKYVYTYIYVYVFLSIYTNTSTKLLFLVFFFSLMYSNTKYVDCCLFQTVMRNFSAAIIIQYNMQRNYRHSILPWSTHHFKGHVFSIQANNSGLVFIVWHNINILKDSIINIFPLTGHLSDSDRCSKWPSDSWHLVQGFTYIKTCDQLKHASAHYSGSCFLLILLYIEVYINNFPSSNNMCCKWLLLFLHYTSKVCTDLKKLGIGGQKKLQSQ